MIEKHCVMQFVECYEYVVQTLAQPMTSVYVLVADSTLP